MWGLLLVTKDVGMDGDKLTMRMMGVLAVGMMLGAQPMWAQEAVPQSAPPAADAGAGGARVAEAPVEGMVRRDENTVAWALAGGAKATELLLHDFEFEGAPVTTNKLHLKELAPGVVEITSVAYSVGEWQFLVRDAANYYGLGERFDTLNHARTIVRNASQDNADREGLGGV